MHIIKFPTGTPGVELRSTADPSKRLQVGPVRFTCMSCGQTTSADFSGMVFRHLDCYCLGCGAFYRVTNPAFAAPTTKPRD